MNTHTRLDFWCRALAFFLVAAVSSSSNGADKSWNKPAGGDFSTPTNWTPTGIPGSFDRAFFGLSSSYAVNLDGNRTNQQILFRQGHVTFNSAVPGVVYQSTSSIVVGENSGDNGWLTLSGGDFAAVNTLLGNVAGSAGRLDILNARNLTTTDTLEVAVAGQGEANVGGGGTIETRAAFIGRRAGSVGQVVVDGLGSTLSTSTDFWVGESGSGELTIQNGASVITGAQGLVGVRTDGSGSATITGSGSSWITGNRLAAAFGATLTIENGGFAQSIEGLIGPDPGSNATVLVTGEGSKWDVVGTEGSSLFLGGIAGGNQNGVGDLVVSDGASATVASKIVIYNTSSSITVDNGSISTGLFEARGPVTVQNGGLIESGDVVIGNTFGGTAAAKAAVEGSLWEGGGNLTVGRLSPGELVVESGGQMAISGGAAVGDSGLGTVRVQGDGSTWSVGGVVELGQFNQGVVEVSDGGDISALAVAVGVADGSSGNLSLTTGGTVTAAELGLGVYAGSQGTTTIAGVGSSLQASAGAAVGFFGSGEMTISGGGVIRTPAAMIGANLGSSGKLTVEGAGSGLLVENISTYATETPGSLHVGGKGEIVSSVLGSFPEGPGGPGRLDVLDGGKVQVASTLTVWGQGTVHLDDGTITVGSGPLESDPNTLRIRHDGTLVGNGKIEGDIVNQGTVSPGITYGILQVTGQYIQLPTGSLQIELGGLTRGATYDAIDLTSAVGLDGPLKIVLADGYQPTFEDAFQILSSESRGGTFSSILGSSLGDGLVLRPFYTTTDVVLEVVLSGDANGDGAVGTADYAIWAATFGQMGENLPADFDFNGEVGAADYALWAANFGRVVSTGLTPMSVPEPSSMLLGMIATGILGICLRRRRHDHGV